MQKVYIMNERLLSILDRWVLFVDKYDVMSNNTMLDGKDRDHYVSNEYLESIQADHIGHPETARSYCIKPPHYKGVDKNYQLEYNILDSEMRTELGVRQSALSQLYPEDGFIAWHSNADASSFNLIFTWSEKGDGYFKYVDPITKNHIWMVDKKGWQCKAGYFGANDEPDKVMYHCAATNCKRITLSYTLGFDESYWKDAIEHINTKV